MSAHDPLVRVRHMRDYANEAVTTAGIDREAVEGNRILLLALTHLVELVGEAASQVPPGVRARTPHVPWSDIIGMRHRLIHGYDTVDVDVLWATITDDLPVLVAQLDAMLPPEQ